jgi:hypothetical protein
LPCGSLGVSNTGAELDCKMTALLGDLGLDVPDALKS